MVGRVDVIVVVCAVVVVTGVVVGVVGSKVIGVVGGKVVISEKIAPYNKIGYIHN